jgi:uncharacterized protein (DUF427 family)
MTLTIGTGPFGDQGDKIFNFEVRAPRDHVLFFEDSPRRVRVMFGGQTVADSRRVKLMHEQGHLPVYYFPRGDVRMDLLEATDLTTHCPFKGDASYWSVRVGDRLAKNAVWGYPDPIDFAPPFADYLAFHWDKMDVLVDTFSELMDADPEAFRQKFRKMAAGPFAFYRGSACLFYADMESEKDRWADERTSRVWIQGDLHAENFGTYMDGDGVFVFDVNDFDEAYLGHFTWDIKRMVASVALLAWMKAIVGPVVPALVRSASLGVPLDLPPR